MEVNVKALQWGRQKIKEGIIDQSFGSARPYGCLWIYAGIRPLPLGYMSSGGKMGRQNAVSQSKQNNAINKTQTKKNDTG
jgi:hypothetical protein